MNHHNTPPPLYDTHPFYHYKGRIGRIRYIGYSLILNLLSGLLFLIPATILFAIIDAFNPPHMVFVALATLWLIMMPISLYLTAAPTIRRLHDLGRTGWMSLLLLIPPINLILLIYLLFAKGDPLPNHYGNPAKPASMAMKIFVAAIILLQILWIIIFSLFFDTFAQSAQMGQWV